MLIDTHLHLNLITQNDNEIKKILDECHRIKLDILFNISVDFYSNFINKELAERYKGIYFSAGIHPSEADKLDYSKIKKIENLISHKKCIGIGETGLDFYRDYASKDNQIKLFIHHLNWAKEFNKPVIVHSRNSFNEIIKIIDANKFDNLKYVFHCFSYGIKEAEIIVSRGYKLSFAGNLTYKNSSELHKVAERLNIENIFIETDAPYLAPVPFRGKTNYPYYLNFTLNFLSKLKNIPIIEIENIIEKNVINYFNLYAYPNRDNI